MTISPNVRAAMTHILAVALGVGLSLARNITLPARPDTPISVDSPVKTDVGIMVTIPATTKGSHVVWELVSFTSPDGVVAVKGLDKLASIEELTASSAHFSAACAGDFVVRASAAVGNESVSTLVTVTVSGKGPRPPPPVVPVPTPVPPAPTPQPTDPFMATLAAAYGQETAADKDNSVAFLARTYRKWADQVKTFKGPPNPAAQKGGVPRLSTFWGAFLADASATMGPTSIPKVRNAVAAECVRAMPYEDVKLLDDATRTAVHDTFLRIAQDLEALR